MLILSISADTLPNSLLFCMYYFLSSPLSLFLSFSFPPFFSSFFFLRLFKGKHSILDTPENSREVVPIYRHDRLDTSNFHASSISTRFWRECCFRFLGPLRMARSVIPRQVSRCAPNWTFFPCLLPDYTDACFVPRQAPNCLATARLHVLPDLFSLLCFSIFRRRLTRYNRNKRLPDSLLSTTRQTRDKNFVSSNEPSRNFFLPNIWF